MVILMLALMISVAISFMGMVGRQRGSALNIAAQTKSDVALMQAQAHTIKTFLESVDNNTPNYTTSLNASWRTEFLAVTNPDGDPFTDDGVVKNPGATYSLLGSTDISSDPLVNASYMLMDMIGLKLRQYGFEVS